MLSKDYVNTLDYFFLLSNMDAAREDKAIGDGGITVDFWIIKVHSSNWNFLDHGIPGIIEYLGSSNTWDHQIPLDHLSPYFHLKWPLDHQIMKDNEKQIQLENTPRHIIKLE